MRKYILKTLAILLCTSIFFSSFSAPVSASSAIDSFRSGASEKYDAFINVLIDEIHRKITAMRKPWEPKSGRELDLSKFKLTFEDNFNGKKLNEKYWSHVGQGRRKGGYWDAGQTSVRNGKLTIRTEYKKNGKYGEGYYCDRVDTRGKFEQTYGYFECRAILPAAKGMWSAFWLTSSNIQDFTPGRKGTEIDVFESPLYYRVADGLDTGLVTSNIHYGGYSLGHRYMNVTVTKPDDPYHKFNTYGVEWNKKGYIFYVNGKETGRSSFGGVSRVPEFMLLSTEVDGSHGKPGYGWSGIITDNDKKALPAKFIVDYVRVYQYKDLCE